MNMILKRTFILLASLSVIYTAGAETDSNNMLYTEYSRPGVADSFIAGKDWFPFPDYKDRAGWAELFASDSASIVKRGERYLDYEWKLIPATAYLAFERTGDRTAMESRQGSNRSAFISLVLAELAEGKGRFIDQIANGAWAASSETSWVLSAHQPSQKSKRALPDPRSHHIDLGSGRYGAIVAVAYHFFHEEFDRLDPSISYSVKEAVKRNILDPYLDDESPNWWLGFNGGLLNNWTPWCNSDVILCFLLMEDDQSRLNRAIERSVLSMDLFLSYIKKDGACEEGPGYWDAAAGRLYDYLQIMYDASDGKFSVYENKRLKRMGEYVSRAYIGNGYVVNFADADAVRNSPNNLVWIYGKALKSEEMQNFALYCMADRKNGLFKYPPIVLNEMYRAMVSVRFNNSVRAAVDSLNTIVAREQFESVLEHLREDVPASTWYPETEQCFIRNSAHWFLGAKGGHNNESHNHNDIGTFILYIRDTPVFIDAGVGTYTRQTFSTEDRYKIWSMQCDWHNLPMINGTAQPFGEKYKSVWAECNPDKGVFRLDISGAYPETACCNKWERTYRLSRSGHPSLKITDMWSLSARTAPDVWHFLVYGEVILPGQEYKGTKVRKGELLIVCSDELVVKMTYPSAMEVSAETKEMDDSRFEKIWGPVLRRISFVSAKNAPVKGRLEFVITEANL